MAGFKNYEVKRNKNTIRDNLFEAGRVYNKNVENLSKSDKIMNGIDLWTSFYRANPHRFVQDYLNQNLKIFQMILIYMMNHFNYFMYIASRGQGKSFLTAIYCVTRAILYPGSKIVLASGTLQQSVNIISEKIQELYNNSTNLQREICEFKTNKTDPIVRFHNGSFIRVAVSRDTARSLRGNILVVDEFRLVDLDIINKVLRKFLTSPRHPKYLDKPEYAHLQERNKEIYLSSAYYKSHWMYAKFQSYFKSMLQGKKYFTCGLPYQVSIAEGLLMKEQVVEEMQENDYDPIALIVSALC